MNPAVVAAANAVPGAPAITAESTREELQAWLQAVDPNGIHTDELYSLDLREYAPCEACDGTGVGPDFDRRRDCKACDGSGRVLIIERAYDTAAEAWGAVADLLSDECVECGSSGMSIGFDSRGVCPQCNAKGITR